ncbi:alpha/beta-hydrolase [Pluteus cervinus]|uniref:Alpha/beta-hydrolase n=1 Tax=Pluteus cervinus TaxID=181527 RepID=A0ACD3BGH0_9AGAR|nr:alpha/beta-hydrolase [Pluteus cervinus]
MLPEANYKRINTSRGLEYNYYHSEPRDGKPYLLLVHGFPSSSTDWRYQVQFFGDKGYGLIVPDMLGYGGTAKPADPAAYVSSLVCQDLIDILDAENVKTAIAVGHDWGSKITSRLANRFSDRFIAFAFLAVGYVPPRPNVTYEQFLAVSKQAAGRELIGYWAFFSEDDAPELVSKHSKGFSSLLVSEDPTLWIQNLCPLGAVRAWLESGQETAYASYISEEDRNEFFGILQKNGWTGPFNWYKIMTSGLDAADDTSIPQENYRNDKPVFFGGTTKDCVCLAGLHKAGTEQFCSNTTLREFDSAHWVMWEANDEVNKELFAWVQGLGY